MPSYEWENIIALSPLLPLSPLITSPFIPHFLTPGKLWCRYSLVDTEYDRAKVPPYSGNDPPPAPGSLNALLFPPLLNNVENKGMQGAWARCGAELPPFISIVRYPGRPVILGMDCFVLFFRERQISPMFSKSWFSGRGWGQQLFSFRSPAVHWMARTSSLNCLSCRKPYQTLHSLNCLPPFHWNPFFSLKSASSHPLPKNRLRFSCIKFVHMPQVSTQIPGRPDPIPDIPATPYLKHKKGPCMKFLAGISHGRGQENPDVWVPGVPGYLAQHFCLYLEDRNLLK